MAAAGLGGWLCGTAPAWAGLAGFPGDADFWTRPRSLDLRRVETGERLTLCYWAEGALSEDAYERICRLLRDVRANRSTRMDPRLLDKLWVSQALATRYGLEGPAEVLSAYRTVTTNRRVGGAPGSLHTTGQAVDYRLPGIRPSVLARLLRGLQVGGVGFYGRWVHADTGDPRHWKG